MNSDLPPIPGAVLPINFDTYCDVQQAMLLDKPRFTDVLETIYLFSRTRHPYIHGERVRDRGSADLLNTTFNHLTMEDTINWFLSPVSWKDDVAEAVAARFLKDHQMRLSVDLTKTLKREKLLQVLEATRSVMEAQTKVPDPRATLMTLETLHKSLILYMWMGQRMPVVFPDSEEALRLKEEAEKGMEFVLRAMTKGASAKKKKIVSRLADGRS